jgi:hypothetical protein
MLFLTDSLLGFGSERPGDHTASLQQLTLGTGKGVSCLTAKLHRIAEVIFQQPIEKNNK